MYIFLKVGDLLSLVGFLLERLLEQEIGRYNTGEGAQCGS